MSSSRARNRFAVVATAVPLMVAGAIVAPAHAASVTVAPYTSIGANNVVGPNAGFRNHAQGIRGNTAVFTLDVSSASASLDKVDLKLSGFPTGPAIVPDRDFAQNDGFAVYKDVSGTPTALTGPDGTFAEIDFAQGPVSTGYTVGTPSGGFIPINVKIDGVRATNSARYFVTVHPGNTAGNTENRDFRLTLPADGVRFGDATTSPAAAVETPRLTIDSKPPVSPARGNFTPAPQPPMERQTGTPKEDAYVVSAGEKNDPDKTLLFLNDGNNTAESNFLLRSDGTPAMSIPPSVTSPISIGDGTGITATSKVARNNQLNDDVFVRAFDTLGNLTEAVRLFDNRGGSGDTADRSNDVTAPTITPGTIDLHDGSNAHLGINIANVANAPARVAYTGHATSGNAATHNSVNVTEARMVVTVGGVLSTEPGDATPWGTYPGDNNTTADVVRVNTTGVGTTGSRMTIQARVLDAFGNTTDIWKSAVTYLKDITPPRLTSVAFELDDGDTVGTGEPGEKIRATWSEPMRKATITETGPSQPCDPAGSSCVTKRLTFPDGGISWGTNPTVVWSSDLTSILITLGPTEEPQTPPATGLKRLPKTNDKVRSEPGVTDSVGNHASDPTLSDRFISPQPPIPNIGAVSTGDVAGRQMYGQGRDGYLDRLTVTFPIPLENSATSVPANLENFKIIGSDVQVPTAVTVTSTTTFTLTFGGVMTTGETPQFVYTPPASGGLRGGGIDVPAFTRVAVDRAAPALQLLTTSDSNADGKLDTLIADYSEEINRDLTTDSAESPTNSYDVPGYEDFAVCPAQPVVTTTNTSNEGATPDITEINLCPKTTHDTAVTPGAGTNSYEPADTVSDPEPNVSGTGWSTGANDTTLAFNRVLDKAPPVVVSRTTKDLNSDGRIDAIDIVYGETLDGFSVENARYIVTGRSITSIDILGSTGVRINIAPIAPGIAGDTDAKPTVQYTGGPDGGLKDASDQRNSVRIDAAPQATTDGAGPAITAACAGTAANNGTCPLDTATDDKMKVFVSEALTAGTVAVGDFAVEQPVGANKAATAVAYTAGDKFVTLTFANNALNPAQDATVRFTAANVVTDASTPAMGNTQTANVTAPAPPAVALNLTCPVPATVNYCGAAFVNTGAVGTTGLVRTWRLSTTARSATPPDSEFSADQPSRYPPEGSGGLIEGELTLFLSGKDDFGRISPEVSDTIEILRSPTLTSVQFVNSTLPARGAWGKSDTVLDGDNVRVGATAFSTDVNKWTAANGGCLSKHMSVDYRGLTRNGGHGAVAPFSCDLNTATAPDSRKMVFPFVKVVGTTKYPVGTVIKQSANDPGWLIVDGPGNQLWRRQFVSVNARRSHMITDASVITVPISVMNGYPRLPRMGFRDGSVVKSATSGYYYMYASIKRPISAGLLAAWKIPTSHVIRVSDPELRAMATGPGFAYGAHPLGTWVRFPDGSINQIGKNRLGQVVRRGVTSSVALKTLTPLGAIYGANHYDRAVPYDATFMRGYRDGTMLRTGTNSFAVVSRTVLRRFANSQTFNSLGFNTANALTFSSGSMPRTPAGYSVGTPIDRYKITSVIIKATNSAGGTALATVLPSIGGLWAVGTIDPIPANWDRSRQ